MLGGALAGAAGMVALFYNNSARFRWDSSTASLPSQLLCSGIGNLTGAVVGGYIIGLIWARG